MKRITSVIFCTALLLLPAVRGTAHTPCFRKSRHAADTTLVIYSTNDMHGRLGGLARIASIVEKERLAGTRVLLLSGGDKFTGNPIVDQHEKPGFPIVDLMNSTGYQYETFGNHEFDYGSQTLRQRMEDATFETLSCNVDVNVPLASLPQPRPYTLIDMDGIRVCILGVSQASLTDDGRWLPLAHPGKLQGLTFHDPVASALKYRTLRDSCDVFIALTHIGIDEDIRLAKAMPELDAIIGGHSHTKIKNKTIINGVIIAQAQCWLKYLAKTTLTLRNNKVVGKDYTLISLSKKKNESSEIRARIESYEKSPSLNEIIGNAAAQFSGKEALSTLMTDAIIEMLHVDIALQNSGEIRVGEIKKGPITRSDILTLNPFRNNMFIYNMTPAELREMLIRAHRKNSRRADLLPGGIRYTIHTQDGAATDADITDMQGKPLDENRTYRVAFNSYINSAYSFPHADKGIETPQTDSSILIDYISRVQTVKPRPARTEIQ